eukprot:1024967-Pelagomonas_calceolata.AAC.1
MPANGRASNGAELKFVGNPAEQMDKGFDLIPSPRCVIYQTLRTWREVVGEVQAPKLGSVSLDFWPLDSYQWHCN